MIYTLTLNAALDRNIYISKLKDDDTVRVEQELRNPGGKGINVSRVIHELGGTSICLGFVGGYAGMEIEGSLLIDGVACDFIKTSQETRTNINIFTDDKKRYSLSAKGPQITASEVGSLFEKIKNLKPEPEFFVMSGSLPKGVNLNFYFALMNLFDKEKVKIVLDADDEILKKGLAGKPFLIKPNIYEFSRLVGKKLSSIKDIEKYAKKLNEKGVEIVIVSMGSKGIVVSSLEEQYYIKPPKIKPKSTVGAGDSTLAGFIFEYKKSKDIKKASRLAVACGAACAMTPGTELVQKEDVDKLLKKVKLKQI